MRSVESQLGIIPLCPFLNFVLFPAFLVNTATYLSARHHVPNSRFSCKQTRYVKTVTFPWQQCESDIMHTHNSNPSLSVCICACVCVGVCGVCVWCVCVCGCVCVVCGVCVCSMCVSTRARRSRIRLVLASTYFRARITEKQQSKKHTKSNC